MSTTEASRTETPPALDSVVAGIPQPALLHDERNVLEQLVDQPRPARRRRPQAVSAQPDIAG
jgi:hypothetical protein